MRKKLIFACGAIALSIGAANAGPCKHYREGRWLRTDLGLYRSDHRHRLGENSRPSADRYNERRGRAQSHAIAGRSRTAARPAYCVAVGSGCTAISNDAGHGC
jgi:hypothetical protein